FAAHSSPSRLTTAAHILVPSNRPPIGLSVCAAATSSCRNSDTVGSPAQDRAPPLFGSSPAIAGVAIREHTSIRAIRIWHLRRQLSDCYGSGALRQPS